MARRLRSVDLDFVPVAPLRLVFAAEVSAPPEAVYRALAEDVEGWPSWFTAVTAARPTAAGAGREVRLKGGTMFQETVLAKEPGERYAYRVDETNAPALQALLEEWRLSPASTGTGTRVQWTFAADGPAPFRFTLRLGRAGLARAFRDAVRNLDERLAVTSG
ncbi:SRPBCC family protein [Streptomyces sp. NBC_01724]|uniref:SRPBCC family protein n=1 Tax=unclassified Streptomyces TaxID=2593676 RepID=UPI0028C3F5AC|nr:MULTISPECIES: SRPBCC family protein [unclassified Streptomyces]WTE50118.1 SRPBCC family protein [Streptomyces sp. NBC_01620]WTE58205.1 SRPBCC family protein [Streptomyces sp. NBC_01617]WTI85730.1 SRPBCC family protein [Streptomyces sp. NBC_00724]WNO63243.1 SRPBCC family protein [Streptomyces sp. AM2-3-1]WSC67823.1 SRPBCC family protein [Streptomyces sp. NBC_01760]